MALWKLLAATAATGSPTARPGLAVKELQAALATADAGTTGGKSLQGSTAEEQEKKIEEHLRQLGYVED